MFITVAILGREVEGRVRLDRPAADWAGQEAGTVVIRELPIRGCEATGGWIRPARYDATSSAVERFRSTGASYALLERVLAVANGQPTSAAPPPTFSSPLVSRAP